MSSEKKTQPPKLASNPNNLQGSANSPDLTKDKTPTKTPTKTSPQTIAMLPQQNRIPTQRDAAAYNQPIQTLQNTGIIVPVARRPLPLNQISQTQRSILEKVEKYRELVIKCRAFLGQPTNENEAKMWDDALLSSPVNATFIRGSFTRPHSLVFVRGVLDPETGNNEVEKFLAKWSVAESKTNDGFVITYSLKFSNSTTRLFDSFEELYDFFCKEGYIFLPVAPKLSDKKNIELMTVPDTSEVEKNLTMSKLSSDYVNFDDRVMYTPASERERELRVIKAVVEAINECYFYWAVMEKGGEKFKVYLKRLLSMGYKNACFLYSKPRDNALYLVIVEQTGNTVKEVQINWEIISTKEKFTLPYIINAPDNSDNTTRAEGESFTFKGLCEYLRDNFIPIPYANVCESSDKRTEYRFVSVHELATQIYDDEEEKDDNRGNNIVVSDTNKEMPSTTEKSVDQRLKEAIHQPQPRSQPQPPAPPSSPLSDESTDVPSDDDDDEKKEDSKTLKRKENDRDEEKGTVIPSVFSTKKAKLTLPAADQDQDAAIRPSQKLE